MFLLYIKHKIKGVLKLTTSLISIEVEQKTLKTTEIICLYKTVKTIRNQIIFGNVEIGTLSQRV